MPKAREVKARDRRKGMARWSVWLALALILSAVALWGRPSLGGDGPTPAQIKEDFLEAMRLVHTQYAGEVDSTALLTSTIRGMLAALDPHSNYLTPREYADLRQEQESEFFGIGVTINQRRGRVYVISVIPGTPADRAGLRYGDAILAVDGRSAEGWSTQEVARRVRGERGTTVELTVERAGEATPLTFRIARAPIPLPTIRTAFVIRPGVGYLGLTGGFQSTTTEELDEQLRRLKAQGVKALLLDLRGNPGGLLDQAVGVASRFLRPGETVVRIRGRTRERHFKAESERTEDMPMVVLINRASASASEIVAGALQDHDRALIVGETSFGKGLVQTVIPLLRGTAGALTLSTARYYTPSGRLIQRDYRNVSAYEYRVGRPNGRPPGPAARTDGGRRVYGGGGIEPDIPVPVTSDPVRSRLFGAVFEFMRHLVNGRIPRFEYFRIERQREPASPKDLFIEVSDSLIEAFIAFATRRNDLGVTEMDIRTHLDYVRQKMREELATARFGIDAATRVILESDEQVHRALEAIPQARQLVENFRERRRR
ncbi:MAG: S41 family peptidase [Acidobacteriota bacterium]|nr:S41 family peptidase [Acidobacteriota bacterium]